MSSRKFSLVPGEYYHVYNRGVDKRPVFKSRYDVERFLQCMNEFNTKDPIGSLYENSFAKKSQIISNKPLLAFVAYCLNPNHYHFLVTPLIEKGIETFMHRLGTGYTMFFNEKYKRSGSLFQGRFKASHVNSNEYLLHVSAYINLNDKTHQLGGSTSKLVRSSWSEYTLSDPKRVCDKNIILEQFKTPGEYRDFALSSLKDIVERKTSEREFQDLLID